MNGPENSLVETIGGMAEKYSFPIFEKNTYSIFKNSQFVHFLKNKSVVQVFLTGVCLEGCILASAFDGFDLGYNVKVIKDLCSSAYGQEAFESGFYIFQTFLPQLLVTTNEVANLLSYNKDN